MPGLPGKTITSRPGAQSLVQEWKPQSQWYSSLSASLYRNICDSQRSPLSTVGLLVALDVRAVRADVDLLPRPSWHKGLPPHVPRSPGAGRSEFRASQSREHQWWPSILVSALIYAKPIRAPYDKQNLPARSPRAFLAGCHRALSKSIPSFQIEVPSPATTVPRSSCWKKRTLLFNGQRSSAHLGKVMCQAGVARKVDAWNRHGER